MRPGYTALYNQFSEEQDFFMNIIPKEHHERFESMMGLIYDMNHEQYYSYLEIITNIVYKITLTPTFLVRSQRYFNKRF